MKNFHCVNPAQYGTQHVLVLADFPPSTKTIDLERLLGNFMNSGVVIRWVNDTVALAVFQTPSAGNSRKTRFSFLGNIVGQCLSLGIGLISFSQTLCYLKSSILYLVLCSVIDDSRSG